MVLTETGAALRLAYAGCADERFVCATLLGRPDSQTVSLLDQSSDIELALSDRSEADARPQELQGQDSCALETLASQIARPTEFADIELALSDYSGQVGQRPEEVELKDRCPMKPAEANSMPSGVDAGCAADPVISVMSVERSCSRTASSAQCADIELARSDLSGGAIQSESPEELEAAVRHLVYLEYLKGLPWATSVAEQHIERLKRLAYALSESVLLRGHIIAREGLDFNSVIILIDGKFSFRTKRSVFRTAIAQPSKPDSVSGVLQCQSDGTWRRISLCTIEVVSDNARTLTVDWHTFKRSLGDFASDFDRWQARAGNLRGPTEDSETTRRRVIIQRAIVVVTVMTYFALLIWRYTASREDCAVRFGTKGVLLSVGVMLLVALLVPVCVVPCLLLMADSEGEGSALECPVWCATFCFTPCWTCFMFAWIIAACVAVAKMECLDVKAELFEFLLAPVIIVPSSWAAMVCVDPFPCDR